MGKRENFILAAVLCLFLISVGTVSAQTETQTEVQTETQTRTQTQNQVDTREDPTAIKPGIIASTGSYTGRADIATSKGSDAEDANSVSPVTASITRERGDRCTVTFKNNGESAYSLSGHVLVQRGSSENRRFFSLSVPAGQSQTRTISGCYSDADSVAVNLAKATKR